jgi:hypothetical protein
MMHILHGPSFIRGKIVDPILHSVEAMNFRRSWDKSAYQKEDLHGSNAEKRFVQTANWWYYIQVIKALREIFI